MNSSMKAHWDRIYAKTPITQLGWYEAQPLPSLQLIQACAVPYNSPVVDTGSGASTLISRLLELGYQNIYAVDISGAALEKARAELGVERAAQVRWLEADITAPAALTGIENAAIWHDRAVFHFLTSENDRQAYLAALLKALSPEGFVIIAAFAQNGAEKCSGLPVHRYSVESLCEFFGKGFKLVESLEHTYQMPSGDLRPYVYARFQRVRPDNL